MLRDLLPVADSDIDFDDLDLTIDDIPTPVGYRVLVDPVKPVRRTGTGIVLADETVTAQKYTRYHGKLLRLGERAYTHPKFEGVKWCQPGDWVTFNPHGGHLITLRIPLKPEAKKRFDEELSGIKKKRDYAAALMTSATRDKKPDLQKQYDSALEELSRLGGGDGSVEWVLLIINDEDIETTVVNPRHLVTFF